MSIWPRYSRPLDLPVRLRHLHLPGLTSYEKASRIQNSIFDHHFENRLKDKRSVDKRFGCPWPQLLTFQTPPTYTCGRREIGILTREQVDHLKAGGEAEFHEAQRGGQTTFHGPGQLTAYIICTLTCHDLTPKKFVHLLEESIINTCKVYNIDGERTENPGVWTQKGDKIASVGVHVRRYITSHGIALNISPDLKWFDRIVACGLPEKRATSFEREGITGIELDKVADTFAQCLSEQLDLKGFQVVTNKKEFSEAKQERLRDVKEQLRKANEEFEQLMHLENGWIALVIY